MFLDHGSCVKSEDSEGSIAFHTAAALGKTESVKVFLRRNVDFFMDCTLGEQNIINLLIKALQNRFFRRNLGDRKTSEKWEKKNFCSLI